MMEVQHNVIPMVTTFVVQNGDFVGSLQNIVIARNVLTLGKVAPWISQKLKVCLVKILNRFCIWKVLATVKRHVSNLNKKICSKGNGVDSIDIQS